MKRRRRQPLATNPTAVASNHDLVVGWREWLSLPSLGIARIKAKIDTGARTSALHTHDFTVFQLDGNDWVRFHIHPIVGQDELEIECEAPVVAFRSVKDSGGHVEQRPFIRATVAMASRRWPVELSLTNRESMKFRMLLGRTAMEGHVLVAPGASYLAGPVPKGILVSSEREEAESEEEEE